VKNNFTLMVLALLAIVFGCAAEEMLPKIIGVGFPVLMSAVIVSSPRRDWFSIVVFAIAAGGAEDAISSLPMMTSPVYFLAIAFLRRRWDLSSGLCALFYPIYQIWLIIWPSGAEGPHFLKVLTALPVGVATIWAMEHFAKWIERKAAVNEAV
jgi:hypothetical protein